MNSARRDTAHLARAVRFEQAQPLERRRLQCYLALMLGDIAALFFGFLIAGQVYLGGDGPARGAVLAQLLLPVFLTVALYNDAYSLAALQSARIGSQRALGALAIAMAMLPEPVQTSAMRSGACRSPARSSTISTMKATPKKNAMPRRPWSVPRFSNVA